jgi:hypothetical protein
MKAKKTKKKAPAVNNAASIDALVEKLGQPLIGWKFNTVTNMHSINIVHRYNRLNEVLGVTGWRMTHNSTEPVLIEEFDALTKQQLWESSAEAYFDFPALGGITRHGVGSNKDPVKGAARKGAISDAAGNALKDLVGKEAYLGLLGAPLDYSTGAFRPEKDGPPIRLSEKDKFTDASGIVTQMFDCKDGLWLQIDGHTCFAQNGFSERLYSLGCAENKRAECNAKWAVSKDQKWYKAITGVMTVTEIPKMDIPKI